jgi:hypothetical protein
MSASCRIVIFSCSALVGMPHLNHGSAFEGSLDLFIDGIEERRQKETGIASLHPSYGPAARRRKTHPEMVLRASALPQSLLSALAQIVPAKRRFSCGNCVPESRLLVC